MLEFSKTNSAATGQERQKNALQQSLSYVSKDLLLAKSCQTIHCEVRNS